MSKKTYKFNFSVTDDLFDDTRLFAEKKSHDIKTPPHASNLQITVSEEEEPEDEGEDEDDDVQATTEEDLYED